MKAGKLVFAAALLVLAAVLVLFVYGRVAAAAAPTPSPVPATAAPTPSPTPAPTPSQTPEPTPSPTPEPTPTAEPGPRFDLTDWRYTLVNADHTLSGDFTPEVAELENGQYFDSRAADDLEAFIAAARAEGYTVILRSSYRSYATQQALFAAKIVDQQNWFGYDYDTAYWKAARIVAVPGTSEHQLGLACDIVDGWYDYLDASLADTALLQWMADNCAGYGFILRYPEDKTDVTGIMYEPWHFRYVGPEGAAYIMENGLCLEEFWEQFG